MLISTYKDGLNILDGDIIDLYYLENISSYLNMFFENGNDFKHQRYNVIMLWENRTMLWKLNKENENRRNFSWHFVPSEATEWRLLWRF